MRLGLIWAEARGGVIGKDGGMPWHVPEDLAHFRAKTVGAPVIMGRRTWESFPPRFRPLPDRRNIVVTSNPGWADDGAERASSLDEALALAADAAASSARALGADAAGSSGVDPAGSSDAARVSGADAARALGDPEHAWVIGGARLFAEAIVRADVLEVTELDLEVEGDTFAPAREGWSVARAEPSGEDGGWVLSRTGIPYRFLTLVRP